MDGEMDGRQTHSWTVGTNSSVVNDVDSTCIFNGTDGEVGTNCYG